MWGRNFRYAARSLARSPGFTAVAVISLALGIGANTAIFSVFDAVLLRFLPVERPRELVAFAPSKQRDGALALSYPTYRDLRDHSRVFTGIAGFAPATVSFTDGAAAERVEGEIVSGNYFEVLGVGAAAGRVFTPADDRIPLGHPVAVLSYDFWNRRFGLAADAVGRRVSINGHPFTVVGVSRQGFAGTAVGRSPDVRIPMMMQPLTTPGFNAVAERHWMWLQAIARLTPGTDLRQAEAAADALYRSVQRPPAEFMNDPRVQQIMREDGVALLPAARGLSGFRAALERPLHVLMAAVVLLLLIACANVASLLIARAAARSKEIAVRMAMGASRAQVAGTLLAESLLLAAAGGIAGVGVGVLARDALLSFLPQARPDVSLQAPVDLRVLGFTAALTLATCLLFGVAPALRAARADVSRSIKGDEYDRGRVSALFLRRVLVGLQVSLSVALLACAGLFMRTLGNLRHLDTGFEPSRLVAFSMDPRLSGYSAERTLSLYAGIEGGVRSLPGVESAACAALPLFTGALRINTITTEGGLQVDVGVNTVTPGFFETAGIPLLRGRTFYARDGRPEPQPKSVVVSESMARRIWPGENPLGKRISMNLKPPFDIEVVGVIGDGRYRNLREPVGPMMFLPASQQPAMGMTLYVRSSLPASGIIASVRALIARTDPQLTVYNVRTVEEQIERSLTQERMISSLASAFGAVALLLAATGLYGVVAYAVLRRTREIGIRVALGARAAAVIALVLRQSAGVLLLGSVAGLALAAALGRLASTLLYGVEPVDGLTYLAVVAALLVTGLVASGFPARSALRIEPAAALRHE